MVNEKNKHKKKSLAHKFTKTTVYAVYLYFLAIGKAGFLKTCGPNQSYAERN